MEEINWDLLSPRGRLDMELRLMISAWVREFNLEETWPENLHVVDMLNKHIFPQIQERLSGSTGEYDFYLKFHSTKNKIPKHNQHVVYIKPEYSQGAEGISLQPGMCLYEWVEIDEDGEETGTTVCYTEGDEPEPDLKLGFSIDEYSFRLDNMMSFLWIDEDEYFEQFDNFEDNPLKV